MAVQSKNEKKSNKKELVEQDIGDIKNEAAEGLGGTLSRVGGLFGKIFNFMPEYLRERFVPAMIPAIVMMVAAIFVIYSSKVLFTIFVMAMAVLMAFEWITIARSEDEKGGNKWKLLGLIYILLPCSSLVYIINTPKGPDIILWLFLVVWATDIAALIVGRTVAGPKIAPSISPNKTWSGLIGGMTASMFVGLLSSVIFKEGAAFFIVFSGLLAIVEQTGDFMESKFKRYFGVKESGNIIPGHGGVMDRVDGLTFTAPLVAFVLTLSSSIF